VFVGSADAAGPGATHVVGSVAGVMAMVPVRATRGDS